MTGVLVCLRKLHARARAQRSKWKTRKMIQFNGIFIPHGVIDMIIQHLPPESVVSLALTCRNLSDRYLPQPALSHSSTRVLLEWLEQDIPHLYLCHDCNRLHRWRWILLQGGPVLGFRLCKNPPGEHLTKLATFGFGLPMTYAAARLAMNRHLHDYTHGPDAGSIVPAVSHARNHLFHIDITRTWSAKIINDNLYVYGSAVYSIERKRERNKKGTEESMRKLIETFGHLLVCPHLEVPIDEPTSKPSKPIIAALARDRDSARLFCQTPEDGKVGSCAICWTDYQIQISLHACNNSCKSACRSTRDWTIQIDRWHKLGACRSPRDLEWYNHETEYLDANETLRKDVCAAGDVCRTWRWQYVKDHFAWRMDPAQLEPEPKFLHDFDFEEDWSRCIVGVRR
ncbi:hypothetical protein QBC41DRAFT_284546 [Cercophora samala]|uniref:F-box domain-containing protein n=1 Tax=Cercophora samala TaxID=330535 RepID=A0AA40D523_9PEZI|nr:hypothetical protein QBC41DRAFT_284546 [Cercophora samala]